MDMSTALGFVLGVPSAIVWLGLIVIALYDLVKRERVRGNSKILWGAIIVLFSIIGPLSYLGFGRKGASSKKMI
jgi:hypothetical protein